VPTCAWCCDAQGPSLEVQILLFLERLSGNGENLFGLARKTPKQVNRIMHSPPPHVEPIEDIYEPKAGIHLGAIPTRGPELTVQNNV